MTYDPQMDIGRLQGAVQSLAKALDDEKAETRAHREEMREQIGQLTVVVADIGKKIERAQGGIRVLGGVATIAGAAGSAVTYVMGMIFKTSGPPPGH